MQPRREHERKAHGTPKLGRKMKAELPRRSKRVRRQTNHFDGKPEFAPDVKHDRHDQSYTSLGHENCLWGNWVSCTEPTVDEEEELDPIEATDSDNDFIDDREVEPETDGDYHPGETDDEEDSDEEAESEDEEAESEDEEADSDKDEMDSDEEAESEDEEAGNEEESGSETDETTVDDDVVFVRKIPPPPLFDSVMINGKQYRVWQILGKRIRKGIQEYNFAFLDFPGKTKWVPYYDYN